MNTQRHINPYYSPGIKRNPLQKSYSNEELMTEISRIVCKQYNIKEWQLKCNRRFKELVRARQMFCYLTRQTRIDVPLKTMGTFLGGRDHSTIIHSIQAVENDLTYIKETKLLVEFFKREIGFIL
jgi:chromosomal replication initiator protein